jgi:hypothetical protein
VLLDDADKIEAEAADSNGSAVEDAGSIHQDSQPEMAELHRVAAESVPAFSEETPENCGDNQNAVSLHFEAAENCTSQEIAEFLNVKQLERIYAMTPTAIAGFRQILGFRRCDMTIGKEFTIPTSCHATI